MAGSGTQCSKNCSNEIPVEFCDRRDVKLKEAEKTIANKDVIIQMLQNHVKKLENSYKQNLEQTEEYRYKFYIAADQIKRMNGACIKIKDRPKQREDGDKRKCGTNNLKESTAGNCKYMEQMKNVEKSLRDHKELLKILVQKVVSKTNIEPTFKQEDATKTECMKKLTQLQEEITRLKDENTALHNQLQDNDEDKISLTAKDSLLETYKRANAELQKKMSIILLDHVKNDSAEPSDEELSVSGRKVSFPGDMSTELEKLDKNGKIKTSCSKVSVKISTSNKIIESPSDDEVEDTIQVSSSDHIPIKTYNTKQTNESKALPKTTKENQENSCITKNFVKKIDEIGEKVDGIFTNQVNTNKNLELVKTEVASIRVATETCNQNISRLTTVFDEHKGNVLSRFQEHKSVTDNLLSVNEEIKHDIKEMSCKIDKLCNNLHTSSVSGHPNIVSSKSSGVPTVQTTEQIEEVYVLEEKETNGSDDKTELPKKLDEKTSTERPATTTKPCGCPLKRNIMKTSEDKVSNEKPDNLEANWHDLEEVSKLKDQKIKSTLALICYYTNVIENIQKICCPTCPKEEQELAVLPEEEQQLAKPKDSEEKNHDYITLAKDENSKLKTTLSAVIDNLNVKISELKTVRHREGLCGCSQTEINCITDIRTVSSELLVSCHCDLSSNNSNCVCGIEFTRPNLEIEEIYNVVRRAYTSKCQPVSTSSNECMGSKIIGKQSFQKESPVQKSTCTQENDLCRDVNCDNCHNNIEVSPNNVKNDEISGELLQYSSENCNCNCTCQSENLVSDLEQYLCYLNEQLSTITAIADRIEDLQSNIKTPN